MPQQLGVPPPHVGLVIHAWAASMHMGGTSSAGPPSNGLQIISNSAGSSVTTLSLGCCCSALSLTEAACLPMWGLPWGSQDPCCCLPAQLLLLTAWLSNSFAVTAYQLVDHA